MSDFQSTGPKKTILNLNKLQLSAPLPNQKGKWAKFYVDVYSNNPRLVVRTNDPSLEGKENNFGQIRAALDPIIWSMWCKTLEDVIAHQGETKRKIEVYGIPRPGQGDNTPKHTADIWLGKNAEGRIFVSVIDPDPKWPKLQFFFGPSDERWAKFYNAGGEQCTKAEVSQLAARAYLHQIGDLMTHVLAANYVEYQRPPGQGGGGGGYNRGGQGGGGGYGGGNKSYQQRPRQEASEPAGDDFASSEIPF